MTNIGEGLQFKSYEYKTGEIMVLELADSVRKSLVSHDKGSLVQSLKGQIKLSDFGSSLRTHSKSYREAMKQENTRIYRKMKNQIKKDAIQRAQIYIPQTPETAQIYQELAAIISDLVGGVSEDILHQTAYELIKIFHTEGFNDTDRQNSLNELLCIEIPQEIYAKFFSLAPLITDFKVNTGYNTGQDDDDGIISIVEMPGDDDEHFSSSDDDDGKEAEELPESIEQKQGGWTFEILKQNMEDIFKEEGNSKLEIVLKLLSDEEGSRLETSLARVIGFNRLDVVRNIVLSKDLIIVKEEKPRGRETLNFNDLIFQQGNHFLSNEDLALPADAVINTNDKYQEIYIEQSSTTVSRENLPHIVAVRELPEYYQAAFSGYSSLNRIQSVLSQKAIETDENLLVAAPTGSGKTNIALLCMLHEFSQHDDTKIVYVAPMKSLVQEMVGAFSFRLSQYEKTVVELSGDSSASKAQLSRSDVIVTTPEKWDVITRKVGSRLLTEKVSLLIIDEIHLLHDERGPVLEALIARMKRTVDTTGQRTRFVGLSATMPNYDDIAHFIRATDGCFVFDETFRPVPLDKRFIGMRNKSGLAAKKEMNELCYKMIEERVEKFGYKVLVFVHSRRETIETCRTFIEKAADNGKCDIFLNNDSRENETLRLKAETMHNKDLKEIVPSGFAFHNAGLEREDRAKVEKMFADGDIKVLVSTATLAWGVNLPAHTVIIKGTRIYSPERSQWESLGHLDVLQMFGRAGRPQFDTKGEGIIMTDINELQYYVSVLNHQMPIESHMLRDVASHLNAEISLGTITSIDDAAEWIGYTYLFVRMLKAPKLYGVKETDDLTYHNRRLDIAHTAALMLHEKKLIIYDQAAGSMQPTTLGRIAANFYITPDTMFKFSKYMKPQMNDIGIFSLFSSSSEFKQISIRTEEKAEVAKLITLVPIPIREPADDPIAKVNVLLQCYICRLKMSGFSLNSDIVYIAQSGERIFRCMFEIALNFGWAELALLLLNYCKMVHARMWGVQSPLRQFRNLPDHIVAILERKNFEWGRYFDLSTTRLGELARSPEAGQMIYETLRKFPRLKIQASIKPLLNDLLRMDLEIEAEFDFDPSIHNDTEPFWVFACDGNMQTILHSELFLMKASKPQCSLSFVLTLLSPPQPFYYVKVVSDRWIPCEANISIPMINIKTPMLYEGFRQSTPYGQYDEIIQISSSMIDKSLFISSAVDEYQLNCALRIVEHAINQLDETKRIAVIIPAYDKFKHLVKNFSLFQALTGDPDVDEKIITKTQYRLVIGTPSMFTTYGEFHTVILFDLHLIGDPNYTGYEMVVSALLTFKKVVRFVGFSALVADPVSFARWLGVENPNIYAFIPSDSEVNRFHVRSWDYPTSKARQQAMSRPVYSIVSNSNTSLVYVPTMKQLYSTSIELVNFANITNQPTMFKNTDLTLPFIDETNKHLSQYGISVFHPNLYDSDKEIIYNHYGGAIKCIVCLIDSIWDLQIKASVIIVKGTDLYDGTAQNHAEYPVHYILEAMGHAETRSGFHLFTHRPRKDMYVIYLSEPLPVESNFDTIAPIAFNFAICNSINTCGDLVQNVIAHTYFFRRLIRNMSYYGIIDKAEVNPYVSDLVDKIIEELVSYDSITINDEEVFEPTVIGQVAANRTVDPSTSQLLARQIQQNSGKDQLLAIICASIEFSSINIRSRKIVHQLLNLFIEANPGHEIGDPEDPSTFARLLIWAHMNRILNILADANMQDEFRALIITLLRVLIAAIDISAARGFYNPTITLISMTQLVIQGAEFGMSELYQIPYVTREVVDKLASHGITTIEGLAGVEEGEEEEQENVNHEVLIKSIFGLVNQAEEDQRKWDEICAAVNRIPNVEVIAQRNEHSPTNIIIQLERYSDIDESDKLQPVITAVEFPIVKSERWWVLLISVDQEVIAIKKVNLQQKKIVRFDIEEKYAQAELMVYAMCDSYYRCDRSSTIPALQ